MKKLKIYQPGLISLILLPFFCGFQLLNQQIKKESRYGIVLYMPDQPSDSRYYSDFSIEKIRKKIKILNNYNYHDSLLLEKIVNFLQLKINKEFTKTQKKSFQYGISIKISPDFKYKELVNLLNICMKNKIDRYFLDLKRNEFVIVDEINAPKILNICGGVVFDNCIITEKINPEQTFKEFLDYYGNLLIVVIMLFIYMSYLTINNFNYF